MRCHFAEEKHQCNQTWCWNVERQAVGSVRRHFTIKLCGPFGILRHPSALCDLSDPLWFFSVFAAAKLSLDSPKQAKPVYHEQRCGKPNLPISFFGFWWVSRLSWTPRQWQIRPSKHEKLTSWNTCSFWEHTRRKHRQKHIQEMQLHTLPEFPEDLDVMVFNSFAMYFLKVSFTVMPWWCPHVTKSTRWQRDPPVCLRLNLSVFATQRFLMFLLFIAVSAGCDLIRLVADMVMLGAKQGFVN